MVRLSASRQRILTEVPGFRFFADEPGRDSESTDAALGGWRDRTRFRRFTRIASPLRVQARALTRPSGVGARWQLRTLKSNVDNVDDLAMGAAGPR